MKEKREKVGKKIERLEKLVHLIFELRLQEWHDVFLKYEELFLYFPTYVEVVGEILIYCNFIDENRYIFHYGPPAGTRKQYSKIIR